MQLDELSKQYPNDPAMRFAARTFRVHKLLTESQAPQQGIYWLYPVPNGNGFKWQLIEFFEEQYKSPQHSEQWPEMIELLAYRWGKNPATLKRQIGQEYAGLPRGRVSRTRDRDGDFVFMIAHGGEIKNAVNQVLGAFNLRALHRMDQVKAYEDEHEKMLDSDYYRVCRALGVELGLAPQPVYDFD